VEQRGFPPTARWDGKTRQVTF